MSKFSTSYENVENVIATIRQATMRREIVSLYLNNQDLINSNEEARKALSAALNEFDRHEASQMT